MEDVLENVSELQRQQYSDVRCWLANLYKYCLIERPHLKDDTILTKISEWQKTLPADVYISSIEMWHIWLVTYMLIFNQKGWLKISKHHPDGIDFSTTKLPKIADHLLLGLSKHSIFEGKDFTLYLNALKLTSAEKETLKALAVRLS